MDRNEEFRKRLDKRLNRTVVSGRFGSKRGFDPTPYVDILMEKSYYEDVQYDDDLQEFIDDVLEDPQFDFIFGPSSLLNTDQKTKTATMLLQRIHTYQNFDPEPHADGLMGIYGTPAFDKYIEFDEDGDGEEEYNFEPYFANYDFTKEQKELIVDAFSDLQIERLQEIEPILDIGFKQRIVNVFIFLIFALLPPFFIPNFLQRLGWLPSDAGWLLKIGVGIVSFIVLFIVVIKVIGIWAKRTLKRMQDN